MKIRKTTVLAMVMALGAGTLVPVNINADETSTPNPIVKIAEGEASIVEYDIPDDIMENLVTNPSNLKRPKKGQEPAAEENIADNENGDASQGKGTNKNEQNNTNTNTKNNTANANTKKGTTTTEPKKGPYKGPGYRIQVFSDGSNPSTLQSRAKARGNAIVAKFPKYKGQVYSFSSSPNWYTRVGNFKTSEEASKALSELKRAFPSFAGEMRVVKSQVVINK